MLRLLTRTLTLISLFAFLGLAWGQRIHEAQAPKYSVNSTLMAGTLNVVLANKNGIVVVSDSRRSSSGFFLCGNTMWFYCDDSQKLFRTGRRSAMVIAGFAAAAADLPLGLSVASVLRNRFGPDGLADPRGEVRPASIWVEGELEQALTGVAALLDPRGDLSFSAMFAGFNSDGVPIIRQLSFKPRWMPTGPSSVLAPEYNVEADEAVANTFTARTAGITFIANLILDGFYKTDDPVIRRYYARMLQGSRDDMSIEELTEVARAILRATEGFPRYKAFIGGKDEIAVLPVRDGAHFNLPQLSTDKNRAARFELWKGFECFEADCKHGPITSFEDFQRPLSEPIGKLFLAGSFRYSTVSLDYNSFITNLFENVTLKWQGGPFLLLGNKFVAPCVLELPENQQLPPEDSDQLSACQLLIKSTVVIDKETLGLPLKWTVAGPTSCFKQNPGGGITITAGGDCPKVNIATLPIQ